MFCTKVSFTYSLKTIIFIILTAIQLLEFSHLKLGALIITCECIVTHNQTTPECEVKIVLEEYASHKHTILPKLRKKQRARGIVDYEHEALIWVESKRFKCPANLLQIISFYFS